MKQPQKQPQQPMLMRRAGETDEEQRFREAINRLTGQIMSVVDSTLPLRTAPAEAQRQRHMVRGHLKEAALLARDALELSRALGSEETETV